MSEKLRTNTEIKETAEDLLPSERFRVDPDDYPIFRQQAQLAEKWGDNTAETWGIDQTVSKYVTSTANLIAKMDGTAVEYQQHPDLPKPDHVIYLDKSARPVSWLVNTFWKDFSEAERPSHSYLNVDRLPWFRRAGIEMDAGGYMMNEDGSKRRPTADDFMAHAQEIPDEVFLRVRALFVPGGVETDDLEQIRKMPTILNGKNLLIVDEVADTGATLEIAKYILNRAIPEIRSTQGDYFWEKDIKVHDGQRQQRSVPVWYSHDTSEGRGVGDVNEPFFRERYAENPNPKTRAQALGALALSEFVDLSKEETGSSRELAKEIKQMHEDYKQGKILLRRVNNWPLPRVAAAIQAQGMRLAPPTDKAPDTFANTVAAVDARRPEWN